MCRYASLKYYGRVWQGSSICLPVLVQVPVLLHMHRCWMLTHHAILTGRVLASYRHMSQRLRCLQARAVHKHKQRTSTNTQSTYACLTACHAADHPPGGSVYCREGGSTGFMARGEAWGICLLAFTRTAVCTNVLLLWVVYGIIWIPSSAACGAEE